MNTKNRKPQVKKKVVTKGRQAPQKKTTLQYKKTIQKNQKKQTRKIRYGRILLYIILPVMAIILLLSCIHFPIRNIYITGNTILSDQEIIELAGIEDYPSIFEYTGSEISKKLKQNKYIESVKVKKRKLKEIYIEIKENIPIIYNTYENKTIFSDGKSYEGVDSSITLLNYTPESHLQVLTKGLIEMNTDIRSRISEIQYVPNDVDEERFLLSMNDGNYVYITLGKITILNTYIDIIKNFDEKKGILYLDSGGYFEIKE